MRVFDLPQELFELILCQSILARGVKRGLRLRLVNSPKYYVTKGRLLLTQTRILRLRGYTCTP